MKWFKSLLSFYINSSIHVSLAVVSLVFVTAAEFDFPVDVELLFFIFFGSITGYNFVKYAPVARLHHRSLAKSLKTIQIFSFFCFAAFIFFVFQVSSKTIIIAAFFGLLTLLYALPVFSKDKNLRSVAGIKIFIIALVWAGVTVILPVFEAQLLLNFSIWVEFVQRLLFIIAITLPFEIRDLKYDDSKLKTIPQIFGIKKTKKFGILLLLFWFAAEFLQEWSVSNFLIYFVVFLVAAFLILKSSIHQSRYYAAFWIEALPILWCGLILIEEIF